LCNSAGLIAPTLLLLWFYDSKTVGSFALAQRVTSIPTTFIGNSISQVFLANASSLIREDPCELKRLYSRSSVLLLGISLLIGFGLMFSPLFFPLLFGEKWQESGIMVQYMTVMFVPSLCIAPLTLLEWLQKQHWFFAWNLIRFVLVCLGFWLAHLANWSATVSIAVFSLIMTIMYVLLLIINWYAINLRIAQHLSHEK
jgi:O-antigen/teichoic acid export membrane protein